MIVVRLNAPFHTMASGEKESLPVYRVIFHQQDQLFEVYVRGVYQSDLYGFVEIEDFLFGERSRTVVDPAEERLKTEFQNVGRVFVPMHAVVRIDEVEKAGVAKVRESRGGDSKIMPFPLTGRMPVNQGDSDS